VSIRIGWRIVLESSVAARGKPDRAAHFFLNVAFVSQLRNDLAPKSGVHGFLWQAQKAGWVLAILLGEFEPKSIEHQVSLHGSTS